MSEKINSKELARLMASHPGVTSQASNAFMEAFAEVFEDALLRDKVVKINGVGTFKLVWHAPRKSVNVRTGDEMEIAGHYKISFLPDSDWNTKVNEPMAHLEAVELPGEGEVVTVPTATVEDVDSESPAIDDENKADDYVLPMEHLNEQVTEVKSLLAGIMGGDVMETTETGESVIDEVAGESKAIVQSLNSEASDDIDHESMSEETGVVETEEITLPKMDEVAGLVTEIQAVSVEIPEPKSDEPSEEVSVDESVEDDSQEAVQTMQSEPASDEVQAETLAETDSAPVNQPLVTEAGVTSSENQKGTEISNTSRKRVWPWLVGVCCLLLFAGLGYWAYNEYYIGVADTLAMADDSSVVMPDTIQIVEETVEEVVEYDSTYYFPPEIGYETFDVPRKLANYVAYRTVTSEDRLVTLALQYYGHKFFWVYIFEANRDVLSHPDKLTVGQQLKIPQMEASLIDVNSPDLMEYVKKLGDVYVGK